MRPVWKVDSSENLRVSEWPKYETRNEIICGKGESNLDAYS